MSDINLLQITEKCLSVSLCKFPDIHASPVRSTYGPVGQVYDVGDVFDLVSLKFQVPGYHIRNSKTPIGSYVRNIVHGRADMNV